MKQIGTTKDGFASGVVLCLSTQDIDAACRSQWPFGFRAEYQVVIGHEGLQTTLWVRNDGEDSFSFTFAFHNYFEVSDISNCQIFGLENIPYYDRLKNDEWNERGEENLAGRPNNFFDKKQ